MEAGHRAVIFDRFRGVLKDVAGEGTHFYIPWVQKPIMYDVRSNPRNIPVMTPSKGACSLEDFLIEQTRKSIVSKMC